MALLVFLAAALVGIGIAFVTFHRVIDIAEIYEQYFPEGQLVDGILVLQNDTPVEYKGKGHHIIMDVTGSDLERDPDYPVSVFFLRDKIVFESDESEPYEMSYPKNFNWTISGPDIHAYRYATAFFAMLLWGFLLFIDWSMRIALMTMIGSFVVGIMSTFYRILLPRNEQLKIALTAAAPVAVLTSLENFLLLREAGSTILPPFPTSLHALNILAFAILLILGSRGYLLPFLPKNPE